MQLRSVLAWVLAAAALASACTPPPEEYSATIARHRAEKDEFLRGSPEIIPPPVRERFLPLEYFDIDESYAVPAQLQPATERLRIQVPTSTGRIRDMERVGYLQFTLKGKPLKLSALVDAGSASIDRLSVLFSDLTSGTETYQAGRYLDLEVMPSGLYLVDFNLAYHPYCYYNPEYDCPYPPPENRLPLPIRAGEKLQPEDMTVPQ